MSIETKTSIGERGERLAEKYLENLGYNIIDRNFRSRFGEIDLIAVDEASLVFVEVKFRKNTKYGHPMEFVSIQKQKKIIKTALYYLKTHRAVQSNYRFDVIGIVPKVKEDYEYSHIRNAFLTS